MSTHLEPHLALTAPTLNRSQPSGAPWSALPVLVAGAFIVVLDFFIVNVALPSMATDLGAGSGALEWIAASYALTVGVLFITAARLGDRLGRRRMYAAGLTLFTVASIACGVAPTAATLIAARVAQGVAGALLMPQVLAIIGITFQGADRARAMGIYSMALGLAAVGGQLIGGALVELDVLGLGWRACFLINVPIGAVALALTPRLVPDSRTPRAARLDLLGVVLVTGALLAVLLPLIEGREEGWPLWTWLSFAAAAVLATLFGMRQRGLTRGGGDPLLDLSLLSERPFAVGLAAQLAFWPGQAAFFVYLAIFLQAGKGLEALEAGLVFTILAVTYVVASGATASLTERHGRRVPLVGGLLLAAGHVSDAVVVAVSGTDVPVGALAPGLMLVGAGMGLCLTSLTSLALASFDEARAGSASGALGTVQEVGNAVGVAVTGVIFFGVLDDGIGRAFALSAAQLAVLGLVIAALALLLPPSRRPVD